MSAALDQLTTLQLTLDQWRERLDFIVQNQTAYEKVHGFAEPHNTAEKMAMNSWNIANASVECLVSVAASVAWLIGREIEREGSSAD